MATSLLGTRRSNPGLLTRRKVKNKTREELMLMSQLDNPKMGDLRENLQRHQVVETKDSLQGQVMSNRPELLLMRGEVKVKIKEDK